VITHSLRPRLVLMLTVVSLASLATVATATGASAASAGCSTSTETRQPVLLVHGYNSAPKLECRDP